MKRHADKSQLERSLSRVSTFPISNQLSFNIQDGSQSELEAKIKWADAFVLMYSVTDKCSFDECCRLRFLIGYNKRRWRHRVIILYFLIFFYSCQMNVFINQVGIGSSWGLILSGNVTDRPWSFQSIVYYMVILFKRLRFSFNVINKGTQKVAAWPKRPM